ncbi:hypothetical protein EMCRGX_G000835 [Ephydatia muelleri]
MASTPVASFARVRRLDEPAHVASRQNTAMISSQPLPRPTAHSLETQQLSSLQPLLRQLQASSAAEHSSSLPSPPSLKVRSRQNVITAPAPMIFPNPLPHQYSRRYPE